MNSFLGTIRTWILDFLRVPPEPHPPSGSPGSLKIFRAGESYRRLLVLRWVFKQVLLVGAFVFWLVVTHTAMPEEIPIKSRGRRTGSIQIAQYRGWITLIEVIGFTFGVLQMPFTYVMATLQYEMRWYMVTDRSLRIREGIGRVKEMTLSFANIQQITVRQNPIQRLFGLSDVDVKSAGGGGGGGGHHHHQAGMDSWHTGVFQHVSNAEEIRDLIVARQRAFKAAGLGDPDDHEHHVETLPKSDAPFANTTTTVDGSTIGAAHELLTEARALRSVVETAAISRPQTPG